MTVIAMNAGTGRTRAGAPQAAVPSGTAGPGSCAGTAATQGAGRSGLELTRRGRFILLGLPALLTAALVLLALCALAAGSLASPAQASAAHEPIDMADYAVSVTVLQGESLWSIASAADPSRDVRDVVSEIVVLNDLGSGIVQAGQRLYVPIQR
ncbi:LysM peptidoglycan-binding domain-containing protein [Specibacter sp. NPDC057265]|uniref:LysM peptidoglycan-binding domain-containing protein n=1 Tax=Specibacter sp. NPDC057265 TaxID=3346075 RepID=UPI0036381E34